MSYVVLARKYRPQQFEDLVGQEHVGRTLTNAIRQNRVHHAYLFAGARGLGKTTAARIFAKGLVCEKGPTAIPCNVCEQCVAIAEGHSVDVMEIDGASNNSVENIRNLREQVHYLPQSARRKVYIIDEVHMLTTSAFNALLKTLEEPPAHVNFVFATTEPQKVLPTILSRVSRLDFRRVSVDASLGHLRSILEREGVHVEDGGLRLIARASGGSVRDSLTLLDQVIAFAHDSGQINEAETRAVLGQADRSQVLHLVSAVVQRQPDAVIEQFDRLVQGGLDLMVLSMQVLEHLRDLTLVSVCQSPQDVLLGVTESELATLQTAAGEGNPTIFGQLFDRFSRVVDRLPTSRTQRLLLEMALLELAHSEPVVPLGDLVERLQNLEQGTPPTPSGGGGGTRRAGSSNQASERSSGRIRTRRATELSHAPSSLDAGASLQHTHPAPTSPANSAHLQPHSGPTFDPGSLPDATPSTPIAQSGTANSNATPNSNAAHHSNAAHNPNPNAAHHSNATHNPAPAPNSNATHHSNAAHNSNAAPNPNAAHHSNATHNPAPAPNSNAAHSNTPRPSTDFGNDLMQGLWAMAQGAVRSDDTQNAPSVGQPPELEEPPWPEDAAPSQPSSSRAPSPSRTSDPSRTSSPSQPAPSQPSPSQPDLVSSSPVCSSPPPAQGLIDVDQLPGLEAWTSLVDRIQREDEYISAILRDAGLVAINEGRIVLAASLGSFAHKELNRTELRARLEQATREHFGRPFQIELVQDEPRLPEIPSLTLVDQQRRLEHRQTIEREARQHGTIQSLLHTFGGTLVQSRPLSERS